MVFTILSVVVAFLVCILIYWWYSVTITRKQLKWLPTVPGIPVIGNALKLQKSTEFLKVLHEFTSETGGLCRVDIFTIPVIIATEYDFLKFILTTTKILDKSHNYQYLHGWLGTGLLTSSGKKWKTRRKIITPAFHFSVLEQFVDVFERNGNILIDLLQKECGKNIDVYPFINLCALDIICESAMGVSLNAQKDRHSQYVSAVKEMCTIMVGRGRHIIKRFSLTYPLSIDYYREDKYLKILHSHTDSVIKTRRESLRDKRDDDVKDTNKDFNLKQKMAFLNLLLQSTVDGEPLSNSDIREEVDTFMFEGHDTTTAGICFTLYCIANHPDIQAKILEEQELLFGSDKRRAATYRELQEMKYLETVIKESLRLYPPVPFFGRRTDKTVQYKDGKYIPRGINIMIFAYGANRSPQFFKDPDEFNPDRFNDVDGKTPYSFIPFSAGPRNCIGQKFAVLEIKSVISRIVKKFELYPADPGFEPILAAEVVLKSMNGVNIKLRRRK